MYFVVVTAGASTDTIRYKARNTHDVRDLHMLAYECQGAGNFVAVVRKLVDTGAVCKDCSNDASPTLA